MGVEVERLWWETEGYERPVGQERGYGPPRLLRGALEGPPFFWGHGVRNQRESPHCRQGWGGGREVSKTFPERER